VRTPIWFPLLRLAASCSVFGLASNSEFGVASSSGFGVALDSGFAVASNNGFGVALEDLTNDPDMGELFPDVPFLNQWSSDELLLNTDMLLEPSISPVQDNHIEYTQAVTETNPDENLFLYLMDSSNSEDLDVNQDQTLDQQYLPLAEASGNIPVIFDNNTADGIFINNGMDLYMEPELTSPMEMQENRAVSTITKADNRHRKGPRPLSKDQFKDEKMFKNAKRCREYRTNKKSTVKVEMTELEKLEAQNTLLKKKEGNLKEKVAKIKMQYVKLISEGRIKFC